MATHRSISRHVASLLVPKSHSSCREQNASLITQSSLSAYANNGFRSSAWWSRSSGLRPCGGAGIPISSDPPLARSHTIVICKENNIKYPTTRSTSQKFPSVKNLTKIPTHWKMSWYPLIKEVQLSHKNVNCTGAPMFYATPQRGAYSKLDLQEGAFSRGALIQKEAFLRGNLFEMHIMFQKKQNFHPKNCQNLKLTVR